MARLDALVVGGVRHRDLAPGFGVRRWLAEDCDGGEAKTLLRSAEDGILTPIKVSSLVNRSRRKIRAVRY